MNLVGIEKEGKPEHKFQFMGVEKEESFGLNWIETQHRGYDAQLGRFHQVDKLADKYQFISPFNYALNNPMIMHDPTGLYPDVNSNNPGSDYHPNKESESYGTPLSQLVGSGVSEITINEDIPIPIIPILVGIAIGIISDAAGQYLTQGKVDNLTSVVISGATGALSGGTVPAIMKTGVSISTAVVMGRVAATETAINVIDSGTKQFADKGKISIVKTVADATFATVVGKAVPEPKNLKGLIRNHQLETSRAGNLLPGGKTGQKLNNYRINYTVAKNTAARAIAPKITENVLQNKIDNLLKSKVDNTRTNQRGKLIPPK